MDSIDRLGRKLAKCHDIGRKPCLRKFDNIVQNNDTLFHIPRPHKWSEEPSGQHSQAHIPTSIEELKIDFFYHSVSWNWILLVWQKNTTDLGRIVRLRPRRRCLGLESPASHISRYHGASYQDVGKFSLKNCCQLTAAEEINQPVR